MRNYIDLKVPSTYTYAPFIFGDMLILLGQHSFGVNRTDKSILKMKKKFKVGNYMGMVFFNDKAKTLRMCHVKVNSKELVLNLYDAIEQ